MKKLILTLVTLVSFSYVFAAEVNYKSVGAHFSAPITFESTRQNGTKLDASMFSVAFGIHATSMYTEKIGMYVNMDVFFPLEMTMKVMYGNQTYTYSVSSSDYESIWGMTSLFAPAISLIKNEKMLLAVSPGIHYMMLYSKVNKYFATVGYVFGIGANIQDSIFFSSNGYFMFGADLAFDFLGCTITGEDIYFGKSIDFTITPRIGIGLRF